MFSLKKPLLQISLLVFFTYSAAAYRQWFFFVFFNGLLSMRKEDILNVAPRLLTNRQREEYFEEDLTITDIVSDSWVEKLQSTSKKFLRASASVEESGTYMIWVQIIRIASPTLDG